MSHPDIIRSLFCDAFHIKDSSSVTCMPFTGAGSNRQYYRLTFRDLTAIGVYGDDLRDNEGFVKLSGLFATENVPVPEIYAYTDDFRYILQQDLGDVDLLSLLKRGEAGNLPCQLMRPLVKMQTIDEDKLVAALQYSPFGKRLIYWDLNYFKYEFLKPSGVVFDEEKLEYDFESLCQRLCDIPMSHWGFMMRDCQSRNVMVSGRDLTKQCWFIDYQGGRLGPCIYDAVSFAWQAKAGFDDDERLRLLQCWAEEYERKRGVPAGELLEDLPAVVLLRLLQVMGAYGFRGLVERKSHFLESIRPAMTNLRKALDDGWIDDYPELKRIVDVLSTDSRFLPMQDSDGLTVTVYSFSYKKGYPEDFTGNGGGFIFDCRAMHNPGRYEKYKQLTGLDKPVRDFFEERGEVSQFLKSVWELTDKSVCRYLNRKFNNLQIGFGCTGGQHRSVYCAENTAVHIKDRFPQAKIRLIHREQGISKEF